MADSAKELSSFLDAFGKKDPLAVHMVLREEGAAADASGQMTLFSATVYGTPSQVKPIEGTPCEVTIDDFRIDLTESA